MSHPQTIKFLEHQKEIEEEGYQPRYDTAKSYWTVGIKLQEEMNKKKQECYKIIKNNN